MCLRFPAAALVMLLTTIPAMSKPFNEMFPQYVDVLNQESMDLVSSIDFKQGEVILGANLASMMIPDGYYFLDSKDANHVLEKVWGNPPGLGVLGMVFPAEFTPLHDGGWGLSITFEEIGYVSDEDAETMDYDQVLSDLRRETREDNKWREENGYGSVKLLGWAEQPTYDKSRRILYWAKELQFEDETANVLNFNIRILGRRGVLVQNFIAGMSDIARVKADLPEVLSMTTFTQGNMYSDFDPSLDTVAAVGIGGLIAAKVAAKSGLIVVALLFLKKAWFLLLLPLFWLKSLFNRHKDQ